MNAISSSLAYIQDTYKFLMIDLADPRTNNWFLVQSPFICVTIITYIYVVANKGPKWMKNREPFSFRKTLIIYNFVQVLISFYLFREGFYYGWFSDYSIKCQPVDFSNNPKALRAARACHHYYLAKIFELSDTVFFVLRKKNKNITFLHVYHHSAMPLISWGATKYYPGGNATFVGMVNCLVHIIMYFYYMMAAIGPQYQKYLWWKKYITTLQLLQFCIIFLHSMQLIFYDCGFPRWSSIIVMPNAILFYYLFLSFYKRTYSCSRKDNKKDSGNVDSNNNNNNTPSSNGNAKDNYGGDFAEKSKLQ